MKFTASSQELQRALSKIGGVIPTKSTLPILEHTFFELASNTLTITGTDLEIWYTSTIPVRGEQDGRVAVPAKRLIDTVRSFDSTDVKFSLDGATQKLSIETETGQYSLSGTSGSEFPPVPAFQGFIQFTMQGSMLKRLIHQTAFAVSTDELRPAMMGVLFQAKGTEGRAVATDGHRLVRFGYTLPKQGALKKDIIIPAKALHLIGRSLETGDVSVTVSDANVKFSFDNTVLVSKLIDESYPNYESVIPLENDKTLAINRDTLLASLRRVALYSNATTHQVRFSLSAGALTIYAQDIDFGGDAKETVQCTYDGESLEIGFNANYLLEILTHMEADEASFKFSTPTRAGIITPVAPREHEDILMLVMPVRLNV